MNRKILINKAEFISSFTLFLLVILFCMVCLPIKEAIAKNAFIATQFFAIALISTLGMINSTREKPFSLRMVFWFFCFAFMFCAGITQFAKNAFRWEFVARESEVIVANRYVLIFMIVFALSDMIRLKPKKKPKFKVEALKAILRKRRGLMPPLLVTLLVLGFIPVLQSGVSILFIRSRFEQASITSYIGNGSLGMIAGAILRATVLCVSLLSIHDFSQKKRLSTFLVCMVSMLICFLHLPPLGIPRYTMAYVYGGIFLYVSKFLKKKRILLCILFFGLLVVFPAMNAFRGLYTEKVTWSFIKESMGNVSDNFATADYDAYTMLVYTVRYTQEYGITWGRQLLGVILFFIPRSLWPNKPGGSGATIIEQMAPSYINPNVSCPIIGEGIMNFGFLGIIVFAIALSKLLSRVDDAYWSTWRHLDCFGKMIYPVLVLFALFMFRGDLMSSFSYLFGMLVTILGFAYHYRSKPAMRQPLEEMHDGKE